MPNESPIPDDHDIITDEAAWAQAQNIVGWHFRIRRRRFPYSLESNKPGDTYEEYDLVEAFFDDTGKAHGWTIESMAPHGTTVEELRDYMAMMLQAFDRPIIHDIDTSKPEPPSES